MAGAIPLASTVMTLLMEVEASDKFHADGFHQDGVHLVINEVVYFQNASGEAFSVFENAVFQSFHVG